MRVSEIEVGTVGMLGTVGIGAYLRFTPRFHEVGMVGKGAIVPIYKGGACSERPMKGLTHESA